MFKAPRRNSNEHWALPTTVRSPFKPYPSKRRRFHFSLANFRWTRLLIAVLALSSCLLLWTRISRTEQPDVPAPESFWPFAHHATVPYAEWWDKSNQLPQHNPSLPYPEGAQGRYLLNTNHLWGIGLNNVMQEHLLNALLAYKTNRSFAFDPFTVSHESTAFSEDHGKMVPTLIPWNAILSGPIVGDPFPDRDPIPRSVTRDYFYSICPNPTVITDTALPHDDHITAQQTLDQWVEKINSIEDGCLQIDYERENIFHHYIFGTTRVLDIWPTFSESPFMKQFGWSSLVHSAIEKNAPLIFSSPARGKKQFTNSNNVIDGLVALHVRRGDFDEHCRSVANWSSPFHGFNSFPELPDGFDIPSGGGWGFTTPENQELYLRRCWPTIEQMVEKVRAVRAENVGKGLKRIFVMTNGKPEWLAELKAALMALEGIDSVFTSRDLILTQEQDWIAQAVDMAVAQQSQVVIGNGFSSMTSMIVLLRMAQGLNPLSMRFW